MKDGRGPKRRWLIPEVVQTSAMDCGPASLKALLDGMGLPVRYADLRDACQTDVDGTSIDTMEELANALGLEAEQIVVPKDLVLLPSTQAFPAIVVVRLPTGVAHFVVVWRRLGRWLQVMDPGEGRRWTRLDAFLEELFEIELTVNESEWLEWASGEEFEAGLRARARSLNVRGIDELIKSARGHDGWLGLGCLDAALRCAASLVAEGLLNRGGQVERLCAHAVTSPSASLLPAHCYCVRPAEPDDEGTPQLAFRGAVLVRVRGLAEPDPEIQDGDGAEADRDAEALARVVARARSGEQDSVWTLCRSLIRSQLQRALPGLAVGLLIIAAGVLLEGVLLRSLLQVNEKLGLPMQRTLYLGAIVAFAAVIAATEFGVHSALWRLGRLLDTKLRLTLLDKIQTLPDHYFRTRLTSDLAARAHMMHRIHELPAMLGNAMRYAAELCLTLVALVWLNLSVWWLALIVGVVALGIPLGFRRWLEERDLRVQSHRGAMSRFYFDALRGLVPVRLHGAERCMTREFQDRQREWIRAGVRLARSSVLLETSQQIAALGLAAWLVFDYVGRAGATGGLILLVYWGLRIPALAQLLAASLRDLAQIRNVVLRLWEPLSFAARERSPEAAQVGSGAEASTEGAGMSIELEDATVIASGRAVLDSVSLHIPAGQHVAIVGESGAGKSSLINLLLGVYRLSSGDLRIDGASVLDGLTESFYTQVAWVDPSTHLWRTHLLDNLHFGLEDEHATNLDAVLRDADLVDVLKRLPDGLQTELGEGGARLSGGQGQRVRLARAMLRPNVRLAILDEAFRGLDGDTRARLLETIRRHWKHATMLFVSHDIAQIHSFDRVLVVEQGRIVEDGDPTELARDVSSRYSALLEEAQQVGAMWAGQDWRIARVRDGLVEEEAR